MRGAEVDVDVDGSDELHGVYGLVALCGAMGGGYGVGWFSAVVYSIVERWCVRFCKGWCSLLQRGSVRFCRGVFRVICWRCKGLGVKAGAVGALCIRVTHYGYAEGRCRGCTVHFEATRACTLHVSRASVWVWGMISTGDG